MKTYLLKLLLPEKKIWEIAGLIALRFHDEDTGEYDDLQEKLYYWIRSGIYEK